MACGACRKRVGSNIDKYRDITEGYKYLTDRQIKARLSVYKRRFCAECPRRYDCDYVMYVNCTDRLK